MSFRNPIAFVSVLVCVSMAASVNAVVQYTVTDLGTLGGTQGYATRINEAGQVTGYASTTGLYSHAFLYTAGSMQDLGALDQYPSSIGVGLNNGGAVAGWCTNQVTGATRAFSYSAGYVTQIPADYANGINDNGHVVGYTENGSGQTRAYLYDNGSMQELGTLGGASSYAHAINNREQITGYASRTSGDPHAFIYSQGVMQDIHTLEGAYGSAGWAINDNGQVVGSITRWHDLNFSHAFLYSDGVMYDLGTFGGTSSVAHDINAGGQVVGLYQINSQSRAFLYSEGTMHDLNDLIDPGSGWLLGRATSINDDGWIVGQGICGTGQKHAFLLTPVPEPTSLALLSLGWVAFLRTRR